MTRQTKHRTILFFVLVLVFSCCGYFISGSTWAKTRQMNAVFNKLPINPEHDVVGEYLLKVELWTSDTCYSGSRSVLLATSQSFDEISATFSEQMTETGWRIYVPNSNIPSRMEMSQYRSGDYPGTVRLSHRTPSQYRAGSVFQDAVFNLERYEVFYTISVTHNEERSGGRRCSP